MLLRKVFAFLILILVGSLQAQELPERYTRYNQALQILDSLQTVYPEICRLDTMGYSTLDSVPMLRFKISDNVNIDEDEPAIFYCGGVHADEVLGVEVVMSFIKDILRRYSLNDSVVVYDINNLEIFCIPFINPEGHIVVENGDTVDRDIHPRLVFHQCVCQAVILVQEIGYIGGEEEQRARE